MGFDRGGERTPPAEEVAEAQEADRAELALGYPDVGLGGELVGFLGLWLHAPNDTAQTRAGKRPGWPQAT
jgi:hypothetical protein